MEGVTKITETQKIIEPSGLIKEFNALGNHPKDIFECIDTNIQDMLERLGTPEKYQEVKQILFNAIKALQKRPKEFTGHYVPSNETKPVLKFLIDSFVNLEKCNFFRKENFDRALKLIEEKNNVLIVQNHTSPMDALVPLAILEKNYGSLPISLIMSQVFEYARVTNLITSGVEKFPVFQPKHINKFRDKPEVINEMSKQNVTSLISLKNHTKEGGKIVFLYPERDRNTNGIGVPEPASMAIPEIMFKSNANLYILPTFVCGMESIFPNSSGRNEMDDFFKIIKRGQGDFYCGEPIKYSDLMEQIESISEEDKSELIKRILTNVPENDRLKEKALISIYLLSLISRLSPNEKMKGLYNNDYVDNLIPKSIV
ncbi:MAG: hypothetical protein WCS86_00085 [Candidatus Paceibacterota bacterium]